MALEIFKLVGSIYVNNDAANNSLAKTDSKAQSVGTSLASGIKTAGKFGAAVVAAGAAAATAVTALATKTADTADEIDKMSQKLGMSTDAYQEWSYVLSQNGMDISNLQTGMKELQTTMQAAIEGDKAAIEQFAELGISMEELAEMSPEEAFEATVTGLQNMAAGAKKTTAATNLFGRSGQNLIPLLNQTAKSTAALKQQANDLGMIMSGDTVSAGVKLGDTIDTLKSSFSAIVAQLGASLMPIIQEVAEMIIDYMPQINGFIEQLAPILSDLMTNIVPLFMQLAEEIFPLLIDLIIQLLPYVTQMIEQMLPIIIELIQKIIPPMMTILEKLMPPLMRLFDALLPILDVVIELLDPILDLIIGLLDPIVTLLDPIINLTTTIIDFIKLALEPIMPVLKLVAGILSETLGGAFEGLAPIIDAVSGYLGGLMDFITGVFTGNWEKAFEGLKSIVKNVFDGLVAVVKLPINTIIKGINAFINGLNKVQVPDWVPGVGGMGINIPNIPELADGGIVDAGQMFVAREAGPELVGAYGSQTAVMNNAQIVDAVSRGVASAVAAVMSSGASADEIGKAVAKAIRGANITATISESEVHKSVVKTGREHYERTRKNAYVY